MIYKAIERDIEATKDWIEKDYLDFYEVDSVDKLIEHVTEWEGKDDNVSFEIGYLRALEVTREATFRYKLKSVLAKVKSALRRIDQWKTN